MIIVQFVTHIQTEIFHFFNEGDLFCLRKLFTYREEKRIAYRRRISKFVCLCEMNALYQRSVDSEYLTQMRF